MPLPDGTEIPTPGEHVRSVDISLDHDAGTVTMRVEDHHGTVRTHTCKGHTLGDRLELVSWAKGGKACPDLSTTALQVNANRERRRAGA